MGRLFLLVFFNRIWFRSTIDNMFDFLKDLSFLRTLSFQRYPDCFALTRETLLRNLMDVLKRMRQDSDLPRKTIFIAAHFPDAFFQLQTELDLNGIDYQIITRPLDAQWFIDVGRAGTGCVYLALAEFLTETTFCGAERFSSPLQLIVVDRHPEPFRDQALQQFGRSFPAVTRMGYFLALEDRVLASAVNETTLTVLKQMGIEDQGLVSSRIISKRISKVLAREQESRANAGQPTDSAEQWYESNGDL